MHGADFLGFVVECESPRSLCINNAANLARPAENLAKRVAVTVNPNTFQLAQITAHMKPDYIQLHGDETPDDAARIKETTGIPVIKAISIGCKKDLIAATAFDQIADYILLDAKPPKQSSQRGGHGLAFDWSILKHVAFKTPYILAGGLNLKNIRQAISETNAAIFDVSSGVESAPGVKDPALIQDLMKAVHADGKLSR